MLTKELLLSYILSFVGTPYIWGSMDCSGFVIEILKADGKLPDNEDTTAQGLYVYLKDKGWLSTSHASFGTLTFYGASVNKITHVAYSLDKKNIIESGGGGPTILTEKDAIKANAKVRLRPMLYRKDLVDILVFNDNIVGFKKVNTKK